MEYPEYLSIAEMQRWIVDSDIEWGSIKKELAHQQPELLERVRASALIESFFPIFTCKFQVVFHSKLVVNTIEHCYFLTG